MMKIWMTIVLIAITLSLSADHLPSTESYKYIWAPSGMNLRIAPGTDKEVVKKLAFGDSLTILSTTDSSYNVIGLQKVDSTQYYNSRNERKAPYILYGNWVEVLTSTGEIGFIIDQYLLPIRPYEKHDFNLKIISQDTVIVKEENYNPRFLVKNYTNDITSSFLINEKYYTESFTFPDMTIQEVFVLFTSTHSPKMGYAVSQNWEGSLSFGDGMCMYIIQQKDGYIELYCECSC